MRKLGRWWEWLLPGLICLCPMGAMAYHNSTAETEASHPDSERAGRLSLDSGPPMGAAIIRVARI
jgi:hypothetical protein